MAGLPGTWRVLLLLAVVLAGACSGEGSIGFSVTMQVVDEDGAPIAGATVDIGTGPLTVDGGGKVVLSGLSGPVLAVVAGDGYLAEPIPVGRTDSSKIVFVRLFADLGGMRWSMHSGGDVMFGRRYEMPSSGDPLLPADNIGGGATYVVENLRRAFSAADFSVCNLETVVSELTPAAAYPGKRFIINSHPDSLAGVSAMGADMVVLANNHTRDYLDEGVRETITALEAAAIPYTGASDGSGPADEPAIFEVGGARIGMFSWTTVDGSFVNDNYPEDGDSMPSSVDEDDAWQYEARTWGFSSGAVAVPELPRRIGSAWRLFKDSETNMIETDIAAMWASLSAVYPELQDWVARRGHGGSAPWDTRVSTAKIAALADQVDVLVVQLHSGFQFQDAPSVFLTQVARNAIDAGADLVIAHHPHVLQGAEWYKDGLIAYSMGNFVFDQDFLITFQSAFLRTVWEGSTLLEARFVLLDLEGYRPSPTAGLAAERNALSLWEKSILGAVSDRDRNRDIRVFISEPDPDSRLVHMRMRNHDAIWSEKAPATEAISLSVPAGGSKPIGYSGLIHGRAGGADVLMGREIFGWGSLEDMLANGDDDGGAHWKLDGNDVSLELSTSAARGVTYVSMSRTSKLSGDAFVRGLARIPMPEHRIYTRDGDNDATPADGQASYSIRLRARLKGSGAPYLRLDLYHFDDTNPTEDPTTKPIGELVLPIEVDNDGDWHLVDMELPLEALVKDGVRANTVLLYVRLSPPAEGESRFDFDELEYIEWRPALEMPERYGAYDYVRNPGSSSVKVTLEGMPLRDH